MAGRDQEEQIESQGTHIATLRAEKVPNMPLGSASHNDLALNRRLAALTSRTEGFVKVEMAVESQTLVAVLILGSLAYHDAFQSRMYPVYSRRTLVHRLWVESHALEAFATVETDEAAGMKAGPRCGHHLAGDRECAMCAKCSSTVGRRTPVG